MASTRVSRKNGAYVREHFGKYPKLKAMVAD